MIREFYFLHLHYTNRMISATMSLMLCIYSSTSLSEARGDRELDADIAKLVQQFRLSPLTPLASKNQDLYDAGQLLFKDFILSGNRNFSCESCHDAAAGTSDALPLSIGQGKDIGHGTNFLGTASGSKVPLQGKGTVLKRNSSALFNLGQPAATHMFWDSRVRFQSWGDVGFVTPEKSLNGSQPSASDVSKVLKRAVDVQALFPLLDADEMRGRKNENELATAKSNHEVWTAIVSRIRHERPTIVDLLIRGFGLSDVSQLNIGHIGAAIGEFVSYRFQAANTPYDRYLRGDLNALNLQQKQGLLVFVGKGKCVFCHSGPLLSNNVALDTAIPVLKISGKDLDHGVADLSNDERDNFQFRTPPLRNISLTAPYMHNGVFNDLKEVINHYDNVYRSFDDYEFKPAMYTQYSTKISLQQSQKVMEQVFDNVSPLVETPLFLKQNEKEALLDFLIKGLTDNDFLNAPY